VTVAGRGVHATSAGFAGRSLLARVFHVEFGFRVGLATEGHVFAQHQQRRPIYPRMPGLEAIKLRAAKSRQYLRRRQIAFRGDDLQQFRRDDVDFVAAFKRHVFKVGMHRNAEVSGSVQGVVVQMSTKTLRPASAGSICVGSLASGNFT